MAQAYEPVIEWAQRQWGVPFVASDSIFGSPQSEEAAAAVRAWLDSAGPSPPPAPPPCQESTAAVPVSPLHRGGSFLGLLCILSHWSQVEVWRMSGAKGRCWVQAFLVI